MTTMLIPNLLQKGQPIFAIALSPSIMLQASIYPCTAAARFSLELLRYKRIDSATNVHNRLPSFRRFS
jgi:hypothetical protein